MTIKQQIIREAPELFARFFVACERERREESHLLTPTLPTAEPREVDWRARIAQMNRRFAAARIRHDAGRAITPEENAALQAVTVRGRY